MKTPRVVQIYSLLLIVAVSGFAQDSDGDKASDTRREVLLYGIETDVLSVIGDLTGEGDGSYNSLLTGVLQETRNPEILKGIYQLWAETEYREGLVFAREEMEKVLGDYDFSRPVVLAAMAYAAQMEDRDSVVHLLGIADNRSIELAASAVRALGKIGITASEYSAEPLLKRLQESDPVAEEDLTAALIVSLGELRYLPAADELLAIAQDTGSSLGHRRFACVAVGQIGRAGDYPAIEQIFYESDDAMLRSYALAGLAEFPDADTTAILVQALKRDTFWRIRVTAAENLSGKNGPEVEELLRYKAENDPVTQVRNAAINSLAASDSPDSRQFLLDYYTDDGRSAESRLACLNALVENRIPGTVDAVLEVMADLWDTDRNRFLEYTCRELSRADWGALAPVFERMLDHDNWLLVAYGIRGIRKSGISRFNDRINAMDAEGTDIRIRREISRRQ